MSWYNPIDDIKKAVKDTEHLASDVAKTGSKLFHDAYKTTKDAVKGVEHVGKDVIQTGTKVVKDVAKGNFAGAVEDTGKGVLKTGEDFGKTELKIVGDTAKGALDLGKGVLKVGSDVNDVALDALSALNPAVAYGVRLGEVFVASAVNTGILQPVDGASQLLSAGVHAATGYKLPDLKLELTPDTKGLGIAGKIAAYAGDAAGFIAPVLVTGGATSALAGLGAGADALEAGEVASTAGRLAQDGSDVAGALDAASKGASAGGKASKLAKFADFKYKTAVDGAISGFVFTPSNGKGNILTSRFEAAGVNAATFGAMGGASEVLSKGAEGLLASTDSTVAKTATHFGINAASGAVGGVASAESSSILSGHGLASASDVAKSAAQFAVTGTAIDGLHLASQKGFEAGANLRGKSSSTEGEAPQTDFSPESNPLLNSGEQKVMVNASSDGTSMIFGPHEVSPEKSNNWIVESLMQSDFASLKSKELDSSPEAVEAATGWLRGPDAPNDLPQPTERFVAGKKFLQPAYLAPFEDAKLGPGTISVLKDGNVSVDYETGKYAVYKPVHNSDGSLFGFEKTTNVDGPTVTTDPWGTKTSHYADGHTLIEQDGKFTLKTPSGNVYENWHQPIYSTADDGSHVVTYGDGTEVTTRADGTETTVYPNKVTLSVGADQSKTIQQPNGEVERYFSDGGSEKIALDGTRTLLSADGLETVINPDGTIAVSDGNQILTKHVDAIAEKLNRTAVTDAQVQSLLDGVAPKDRELASAFIDLGLPNSNDRSLMDSLRSARDQGENSKKSFAAYGAYTLAPGESADTAYLFRKAAHVEYIIASDTSAIAKTRPRGALIFGDLSKATDEQRRNISDAQKSGIPTYHVDLNNFEKGLNYIDFGTGRSGMKLQALLDEAHTAVQEDPALGELSPQELADHVLNADNRRAVSELNITQLRPESMSREVALKGPATTDDITSYLTEHYPSFEDRLEAGKLIDGAGQYTGFADFAANTTYLHDFIVQRMGEREIAESKGQKAADAATIDERMAAGQEAEKNALYIVGDSSDSFVSSVYQKANNLDSNQFISRKQFIDMKEKGQIGDRPVVYLDDTAYSGSQLKDFIASNLDGVKNAYVGNLVSYKQFGSNYWDTDSKNPVQLVSLAGHMSLNSNLEKFAPSGVSDESTASAQKGLSFISRSNRGDHYGTVHTYQMFPYITSDTSSPFIKEFGKSVLNIENPWGVVTSPLRPKTPDVLQKLSKYMWIPPSS